MVRLVIVALGLLRVSSLMAQEPAGRANQPKAEVHARMQATMDSMDLRLDSLVTRMDLTSAKGKMEAVASVVRELVSQHRAMHRHLAEGEGKSTCRGGMRAEMESPGVRKPASRLDATDEPRGAPRR